MFITINKVCLLTSLSVFCILVSLRMAKTMDGQERLKSQLQILNLC